MVAVRLYDRAISFHSHQIFDQLPSCSHSLEGCLKSFKVHASFHKVLMRRFLVILRLFMYEFSYPKRVDNDHHSHLHLDSCQLLRIITIIQGFLMKVSENKSIRKARLVHQ
jgi:hypothetical protein